MHADEWSVYAAERHAGVYDDDKPTHEELEEILADDARDRIIDRLIEEGIWP